MLHSLALPSLPLLGIFFFLFFLFLLGLRHRLVGFGRGIGLRVGLRRSALGGRGGVLEDGRRRRRGAPHRPRGYRRLLPRVVAVFLEVGPRIRGQNLQPGGGIGTVGEGLDADVPPALFSPPAVVGDYAELLLVIGAVIGAVIVVVVVVGRFRGLGEYRSLCGPLEPAPRTLRWTRSRVGVDGLSRNRLDRARDAGAGLTREGDLRRVRPVLFPAPPVRLVLAVVVGTQAVVRSWALLRGADGGSDIPGGRSVPVFHVERPVRLAVVDQRPGSKIVRALVVVALVVVARGRVSRRSVRDGVVQLPVEGALVVVDLLPRPLSPTGCSHLHIVHTEPRFLPQDRMLPVRYGLQAPVLVPLLLQPPLLLELRLLPRLALAVLLHELLRHRPNRGDAFQNLSQAKLVRRANHLLHRRPGPARGHRVDRLRQSAHIDASERLGQGRHLRGCRRDALPGSRGGRRGHGEGIRRLVLGHRRVWDFPWATHRPLGTMW